MTPQQPVAASAEHYARTGTHLEPLAEYRARQREAERAATLAMRQSHARWIDERIARAGDFHALMQERDAARARGDYARADALRGHLRNAGIELIDGSSGMCWRVA